jgi:hypothetical protein
MSMPDAGRRRRRALQRAISRGGYAHENAALARDGSSGSPRHGKARAANAGDVAAAPPATMRRSSTA